AAGTVVDAAGDVTAVTLEIDAVGAVGTTGAPITTVIDTLDATVTGTGGIFIDDTGGLTLPDVDTNDGDIEIHSTAGIVATDVEANSDVNLTADTGDIDLVSVTANGGTVTVTATLGSITDGSGGEAPNITAGTADLTAATGIGAPGDADIDTAVGTLIAETTVSGDIYIDEVDSITLDGVTTAGSDIDIIAGETITVDDVITAGGSGDITLTVEGAGEKVIVNAGADITAGGVITITADDLVINADIKAQGPVADPVNDPDTLVLKPMDPTRSIGIGGGAGGFNLDAAEISHLFGDSITIGDLGSVTDVFGDPPNQLLVREIFNTGDVQFSDVTFNDGVNVSGGLVNIAGNSIVITGAVDNVSANLDHVIQFFSSTDLDFGPEPFPNPIDPGFETTGTIRGFAPDTITGTISRATDVLLATDTTTGTVTMNFNVLNIFEVHTFAGTFTSIPGSDKDVVGAFLMDDRFFDGPRENCIFDGRSCQFGFLVEPPFFSFGGLTANPVKLTEPVQLEEEEERLALLADDERCTRNIFVTMAWQNTASDAAFNVDPTIVPYNVDIYCAPYKLTTAARGARRVYNVMTYVTYDFWTDMEQSFTSEPLPVVRPAFGLPNLQQ
ncbi:MAG: hypothetical protein O7H40_07525, partial [Gammaproteobacteria bacterium]|nr:hypothetical protein [Gammaproteobacteria bacterium]